MWKKLLHPDWVLIKPILTALNSDKAFMRAIERSTTSENERGIYYCEIFWSIVCKFGLETMPPSTVSVIPLQPVKKIVVPNAGSPRFHPLPLQLHLPGRSLTFYLRMSRSPKRTSPLPTFASAIQWALPLYMMIEIKLGISLNHCAEIVLTCHLIYLDSNPLRKSNLRYQNVHADLDSCYRDFNHLIMDYLISQGYPHAAQKFANEANMQPMPDLDSITQRVQIRDAIHRGDIQSAIENINEINPQVRCLANPLDPLYMCRYDDSRVHAPLIALWVLMRTNQSILLSDFILNPRIRSSCRWQ